jgi:hypothetical protein
MKITISVPTLFWNDHYDRCGEEGKAKVIKRGSKLTTVQLDQAAWDNLLGDADYYATQDFGVWGSDLRGLIGSARTTLRRMQAVQ